jgi:hypothetical protein
MMSVIRLFAACGCIIGVALISGCGTNGGPELGTVTGRVTLDGEPLGNARVVFWLGKGRPSEAITDSRGRYDLRYTISRKGALIGAHTVHISTAIVSPDEKIAPERVPPQFNTKSNIVKEVKPGKNEFDFDIP